MTITFTDTITKNRQSDFKVEGKQTFEYETQQGFGFISTKLFNIGDTVTLSSKDFYVRLFKE